MAEKKCSHDAVCLVVPHDSQIGIDARAKGILFGLVRFLVLHNCVVGLNRSVEVASRAVGYVSAVRLYRSPQVSHAFGKVLQIHLVGMKCEKKVFREVMTNARNQ
jgi:hypothetical protein